MSSASILADVLGGRPRIANTRPASAPVRAGYGWGSAFDAANSSTQRGQIWYTEIESHLEIDQGTREELLRQSRWCANNLAPYAALLENVPPLVTGPRGLRPFPATSDKEWNQKALALFENRAQKWSFDLGGKWSFYAAQQQAFRHMLRDGDMFGVLTEGANASAQMQFYEGHQVGNDAQYLSAADSGSRAWRDGVLSDKHGRALAYRIREQGKRAAVVPRENVVPFVSEARRGSHRGVPVGAHWFTDGIDWVELKAFTKASAKNAARMAYYRKNIRGGGNTIEPSLGAAWQNDNTAESPDMVLVKEVEGGTEIINTKDQELAILADPRPGPNTMEFMDKLVWNLALGTGLPPSVVLFLSGMISAEVRMVLQSSRSWIKARQQWLVENYCQRYWAYFVAKEVARGTLSRPKDPDWFKCGWIAPADMTIDIGREGNLKMGLLKEGMLTLAMWAGEQGVWWEEMQDQKLRECARGARRRREIAAEEGVTVEEMVAFEKNEVPATAAAPDPDPVTA